MNEREATLEANAAQNAEDGLRNRRYSPLMSVSFWLFVSFASFIFILLYVLFSIPPGLSATEALWYSFNGITVNMAWIPLFAVFWIMVFSMPTVLRFMIDEYLASTHAGMQRGRMKPFNVLLNGVPCVMTFSQTHMTLAAKDSRAIPRHAAGEPFPVRIKLSDVRDFVLESPRLKRLAWRFITPYETSVTLRLKDHTRYPMDVSYRDYRTAAGILESRFKAA
jgi:hypothetical protein